METLTSLTSTFKERVRSPFYGAFILSWIICNWRIFLAVFFFHAEDLGDYNLVDFISTNYISWSNCLWWPLFYSLIIYIGLIPLIDYATMWYIEKIRNLKLQRKLEIQKVHVVEGRKYVDLLLAFDEQVKHVTDSDEKIIELQGKVTTLESGKIHNESIINELTMQRDGAFLKLKNYEHRRNLPDKFLGRWTLFIQAQDGTSTPTAVELTNVRTMVFVDQVEKENTWNIQYLDIDYNIGTLNMVCRSRAGHIHYYDLRMMNDKRFEGKRDDELSVKFIRDEYYTPSKQQ